MEADKYSGGTAGFGTAWDIGGSSVVHAGGTAPDLGGTTAHNARHGEEEEGTTMHGGT